MSRTASDFMGTPESLFHWIPGEIVIVVKLRRKPAEEIQDALIEQIRATLNTFLAAHSLTLEAYGSAGRWQETTGMPPIRRRAFIFGLHKPQPLLALFFHVRHIQPDPTDPASLALLHLQAHLEQLAQQGLAVLSAMPNWLVTAAPGFYSEGGPALPPRPAPSTDAPANEDRPLGWHFSFIDQIVQLHPTGTEDVLVAVLDTAYSADRLSSVAMRPEFRRNWLLQRLAADLHGANGLFEIEYNRYPVSSDTRTGHDLANEPRYYFMPDHGLFVSGIIRDIAPRVRIRLVRILNDFGCCDLYNLFAALSDLEQELVSGAIRRLVVNLSLVVMPDIRRLPSIWFDQRSWSSTQLSGVAHLLNQLEEGLRLLCEGLYAHGQGALIVAAAGNDSLTANKEGKSPRPPRAPARYGTTMSVSAVNSRYEAAQYANAACMAPLDAGIATFGGDSYGFTDTNEQPDAVRGLYIAPTFPGGEPNSSGWAAWSGTSFSTAIVSALGAHLLAQGWSASNALARIAAGRERRTDKLFGSAPERPELLVNVIRVQQDFEQ
ncbi:MAG TPA: S8 family serine peptidase [Ktedonobacteraceae bacterium]|nr:S8 family serine peptidase [Ktedonobacteraceae bacterium]